MLKPRLVRRLTCAALFCGIPALFASAAPIADTPLEDWRKAYATNLARPDGWLSLVALQWLPEGATTVGSAAANKLKLDHLPAHALTLQQHGGKVELADGKYDPCLKVDGAPAHAQTLLADDSDKPNTVSCNGVQMTVIHRGDRLYLRVKDADSPLRTHFTGLHWFAPVAAARVTAKWVPYQQPRTVGITNVLGQTSEQKVAGRAEFTFDGHAATLEPLVEGDQLFFIFRDETSLKETYGAGRFLYTSMPDRGLGQPGTVVLDFNRARNPPCAYTPFATCPLPPKENRLGFSIPAGEKRFHD